MLPTHITHYTSDALHTLWSCFVNPIVIELKAKLLVNQKLFLEAWPLHTARFNGSFTLDGGPSFLSGHTAM